MYHCPKCSIHISLASYHSTLPNYQVCEANGVPQPIITWKRKGRSDSDHLDNTRRTTVEVTNREMSGPIECIATNGVGEPAVAGINMIVLCK